MRHDLQPYRELYRDLKELAPAVNRLEQESMMIRNGEMVRSLLKEDCPTEVPRFKGALCHKATPLGFGAPISRQAEYVDERLRDIVGEYPRIVSFQDQESDFYRLKLVLCMRVDRFFDKLARGYPRIYGYECVDSFNDFWTLQNKNRTDEKKNPRDQRDSVIRTLDRVEGKEEIRAVFRGFSRIELSGLSKREMRQWYTSVLSQRFDTLVGVLGLYTENDGFVPGIMVEFGDGKQS